MHSEVKGQVIDKKFIESIKDSGQKYNDCCFEECQFIDIRGKDLVYFIENQYSNCTFTKMCINPKFLNGSSFQNCTFVEVDDDSKWYDSLEGLELGELQEELEVSFTECKFDSCHIGTYNKGTFITECIFSNTYFKNGRYKGSYWQKNKFNQCIFEGVQFTYDEKNTSDGINYILNNEFHSCEFIWIDFSNTLFINKLDENHYDNSSVIIPTSKDYIKVWINKYDEWLKEDMQNYFELDCWRRYKELYFCLFNEYKRLSYLKRAYEYYYYYRYIEMKEHLAEIKDTVKYIELEDKKIKAVGKKVGLYFRDLFSYLSCGFGEKPFRLIGISGITVIIFTVAYMFLGIKAKTNICYTLQGGRFDLLELIKDFTKAMYFSCANVLFVVQSDVEALTWLGKVVVLIQTLISYIIMAIFTGLIVRKWFRD